MALQPPANRHPAISAYAGAFAGAALFGLSSPLLASLHWGHPFLTAAILYGSFGLLFLVAFRPWRDTIVPAERRWVAVSLVVGGVIAPFLMMLGLQEVPGAEASLWLGVEPLATVVLGVWFFREHSSKRLWISVGLFLISGVLLATLGPPTLRALFLVGAALLWALDNQASARIQSIRATSLAAWKGLAGLAGNGLLFFIVREEVPPLTLSVAAIVAIGLACYGASMLLVLGALRVIGGGRTSVAFALSPVIGSAAGLALGTYATPLVPLTLASLSAGAGSWLLLSESHGHVHGHPEEHHSHEHDHDEHHRHDHAPGDPPGGTHTHAHNHTPLTHAHLHGADLHHKHH